MRARHSADTCSTARQPALCLTLDLSKTCSWLGTPEDKQTSHSASSLLGKSEVQTNSLRMLTVFGSEVVVVQPSDGPCQAHHSPALIPRDRHIARRTPRGCSPGYTRSHTPRSSSRRLPTSCHPVLSSPRQSRSVSSPPPAVPHDEDLVRVR
eukprot:460444-Hanusia_phi.AAC.1